MNMRIILPDKGILNIRAARKHYQLARYAPSPDLAVFVRHYWIVRWDLRGKEPFRQEILQNPCVNLVFEKGKSKIYGIHRGKSQHLLAGRGDVLGVLFQPGGFWPFYRQPVSRLTDRSVDCRELFGKDAEAAERDILSANGDQEMVALAERFLRKLMPERDERVGLVGRIVNGMMADRDIVKVDDAVRKFDINKRALQRLFNEYVGVSPKWVIRRSRIHEAALRAADGETPDWAKLAVELGYFDQAHLIKDFKTVIGCSPEQYARQHYISPWT